MKSFGVVSEVWQKSVRDCAKSYLADRAYARNAELSARYGFSSLPSPTWKCNMFVAHRLRECGFTVPEMHRYRGSPLPPLANEWAGGAEISGWIHTASSEYVQPGWVVVHPSVSGSGHIGIVDFDGAGIAAGTFIVNRAYDGFIKAGCVYRKYVEQGD